MPGPANIAFCKIHPAVGVARVGDSPDELFIGAESPGVPPAPAGGFKDAAGRVKRQAARFRVYAYDAAGNAIRELTAAEATITWTVHLANRKGAWYRFHSEAAAAEAAAAGRPLPLRNPAIVDSPQTPDARQALIVDPDPRTIARAAVRGDAYRFDGGTFLDVPVSLGELRTDAQGRLLVLGGAGAAGPARPGIPIGDDTDNDGWWDDTADGPVTARVELDGVEIPIRGAARVIVAPPDFAPHLTNLVTLYDVMREVAIQKEWLPAPDAVSFTRDVYPLLARIDGYQWLSERALRGHGPLKRGSFLAPQTLKQLADPSEAQREVREAVFRVLRHPEVQDPAQANLAFMPPLSGDGGESRHGEPATWLALLPSQYAAMQRWAAGAFTADWTGAAPAALPLEALPPAEQPAALDRAALEACAGGAFFPGVEVSYSVRDPALYDEPFRFCAALEPGELTGWLAVPWQASLFARSPGWWPAQRPDEVVTEAEYRRVLADFSAEAGRRLLAVLLFDRAPWARGIGSQHEYSGPAGYAGHNDMVGRWTKLGFVQRRETPAGETVYVECERSPYALLTDRDHYYYLLNIEDHPDYLPCALERAEEALAGVRRHQQSPNLAATLRTFPYSEEALSARLDEIYNLLATAADPSRSAIEGICKTREDAIDRVLQVAPYSQVDGAWLHSATPNGPLNQVQALLCQIWCEESGLGRLSLHHATLYTTLLQHLGLYLPDPHSRAYADNPALLDSAFTMPVTELALAQFPRRFFPELLGYTLQVEWEVLEAKPQIALMRHFGLPTQFYELHVSVDNAGSGHGMKAKRAVQLYLDQVRAEGGEGAMQAAWQRIWTGFNVFPNAGTLARDLAAKVSRRPTPRERMLAMIARKRGYAALNHGHARLGDTPINDWFDDPPGLLDALAASVLIVPGSPEQSPIFRRFTAEGPMFGVFDEADQRLWAEWIRSLTQDAIAGAAEPAASVTDVELARWLCELIDALRPWWRATSPDGARQLVGPDPFNPGTLVSQPLSWWFQQATPAFVRALVRDENALLKPEDSSGGALIECLTGSAPGLAALLAATVAESGLTGNELIARWIAAGCPLPPELPRLRMSLTTHSGIVEGLPAAYLRGSGAIH
jgi:hypothetical protein